MNKDTIISLIQENKREITINPNWTYFYYKDDCNLESILKRGILCRGLLGFPKNNSYNGKYFISLIKKQHNYEQQSHNIFKYLEDSPMIILSEELKTYNVYKLPSFYGAIANYFVNTRIPFRCSSWNDEVQSYKEIPTKYFEGLYFRLLKSIEHESNLDALIRLKNIINILDCCQIDLPIIDETDNTVVDKDIIRKIKI